MNPNEKPIGILSKNNISYFQAKEKGLINNLEVFKGPSPLIDNPLEKHKEYLKDQLTHFRIKEILYPKILDYQVKVQLLNQILTHLNSL